MGLLDRINTLIRANVNDLVRRSDEPERALDSSIGDMEASTREARARQRQVERQEAELINRYERGREEAMEWEDRAMVALREGDEALARECLVMKKRVDTRNERLREELEQQRGFMADLSRSLDALQVKIDAVRSRRHSISSGVSSEVKPPVAEGGFTFPSFSSEPSAQPPRERRDPPPPRRDPRPPTRRAAPAEERFSEGRRAFVFDEDMRREFPEEVFDAAKPFEAFSEMEDRINDLQAGFSAERELGGYEDPLRDDLTDRFRKMERQRDTTRGLNDLRRRAEREASDPPPERPPKARSDGGEKLSDLRKRLSEELDG